MWSSTVVFASSARSRTRSCGCSRGPGRRRRRPCRAPCAGCSRTSGRSPCRARRRAWPASPAAGRRAGSGARVRAVRRRCGRGASRNVWPSTRCAPAVFTAWVVPRSSACWPAGSSHSPASRTLVMNSRSSADSGPNCAQTTGRSGCRRRCRRGPRTTRSERSGRRRSGGEGRDDESCPTDQSGAVDDRMVPPVLVHHASALRVRVGILLRALRQLPCEE